MVQAGKSTNSDGENEKKGDSLNGELENSESKPSSRDRCHSLSRLIDDSSVLLSCFSLFCETFFFNGSITHTTGRLVHNILHGNCLSKVVGQETSQ